MIGQAFLEHDKASHAAVAVLEGVDMFELAVVVPVLRIRWSSLIRTSGGLSSALSMAFYRRGKARIENFASDF